METNESKRWRWRELAGAWGRRFASAVKNMERNTMRPAHGDAPSAAYRTLAEMPAEALREAAAKLAALPIAERAAEPLARALMRRAWPCQ